MITEKLILAWIIPFLFQIIGYIISNFIVKIIFCKLIKKIYKYEGEKTSEIIYMIMSVVYSVLTCVSLTMGGIAIEGFFGLNQIIHSILFFAGMLIPVMFFIAMLMSLILREKGKVKISIAIQFMPLIIFIAYFTAYMICIKLTW